MKITLACAILIGFISIAVLGGLVIGQMTTHKVCLATLINGFNCSGESAAEQALFHLNAAKAPTTLLLLAPFTFALLLLFGIVIITKTNISSKYALPRFIQEHSIIKNLSILKSIVFWRALHELSPSHI
ncbi:hypothetical protein CL629_03880 [bacterium]|nr:hypothetical protein [bacterium]|tara:strand:+ start:17227 stop:17613 length:387 start_codon:yes stop_codon:yes gene_type:complete